MVLVTSLNLLRVFHILHRRFSPSCQNYLYLRGLLRNVKCHYGKRKFPIRIITV